LYTLLEGSFFSFHPNVWKNTFLPKDRDVEIIPISASLERAREIASKKLRDWREDEHTWGEIALEDIAH
jgi:hypothetical protein